LYSVHDSTGRSSERKFYTLRDFYGGCTSFMAAATNKNYRDIRG
jgi:hypothetical protein